MSGAKVISVLRLSGLTFGVLVCPLFAGFIPITILTPHFEFNRTPNISGMAFDAQPNPWILDGLSWQMERLDATDGSVLQTYSPVPDRLYNQSLAWSSQTDLFFTLNQNFLYSIDLSQDKRTVIAALPVMDSFAFTSLAFDPAGNLWVGVNDGIQSELWKIDTSSGAVSFVTPIYISGQLTALSIDSTGIFYAAVKPPYNYPGDIIYRFDPSSGQATSVAAAGAGVFSFIVSFGQQPGSERWYGVVEDRSSIPTYTFYFGEITGIPVTSIPEPGFRLLVGMAALLGIVYAPCRRT
jgi:WD40 repeat protein